MTVCNSLINIPAELRKIYEDALIEYNSSGVFFLADDYILDIQSKYSPYPRIVDELLSAAKALRADGDSALYALFVHRSMLNRELFKKHANVFDFDDEKHPYLAFFVLLPTIPTAYRTLRARGIPDDIIGNTLCHYEECVFIYEERYGRRGLNKRYFTWLQHYVDCDILNIDRLRFEFRRIEDPVYLLKCNATGEYVLLYSGGEMKANGMCIETPPENKANTFLAEFSETETEYIGNRVLANGKCAETREVFSKSQYTLLLRPSDSCLSVHIPPKSKGKFTKDVCMKNYRRALDVVRKHYPELDVKAFRCRSWMLSQELVGILNEESNILKFREPYHIYPVPSKGEDVFNFVFKLNFKTFQDMPENTSLQRAIKKLYLDGKYVYEYGGIFSTEVLDCLK